ncbi:uncharacterized protein LOC110863636 [Folsomia candida]|uniref:C-type lectin domain family 4 member K n=1 Tax=Folsomia candida TaxID=158441 RepID=A0A226EWE5_FOLCA|nr:uncharacterized protein LOC110863636 [Folsomia candida]OXA61975.1 C-type lectin domain family 4 member K [Folsomia candida]
MSFSTTLWKIAVLCITVLATRAESREVPSQGIKTANGDFYIPSPRMNMVGNFGDKYYFIESIPTQTDYYSALTFCPNEHPAMTSVRVDSQEELRYITSYGINTTIPAGTYWTGATSFGLYSWPDGSLLEDLYIDRGNDYAPMCLYFHGSNAAGERLWGERCINRHFPICQIITSK